MKLKKSRIISEMHDIATALHKLGFISKPKMQKYDLLCFAKIVDHAGKKSNNRKKHF